MHLFSCILLLVSCDLYFVTCILWHAFCDLYFVTCILKCEINNDDAKERPLWLKHFNLNLTRTLREKKSKGKRRSFINNKLTEFAKEYNAREQLTWNQFYEPTLIKFSTLKYADCLIETNNLKPSNKFRGFKIMSIKLVSSIQIIKSNIF